jgi:hypothetical protein
MKRLATYLLVVVLVVFSPLAVAPVRAVTGCDQVETQAWWREAGISLPANVGQHIHLGTCWPKYGTILDGVVQQSVTVILHDQPSDAHAAFLRAGYTLNGTVFYKRTADVVIPLDSNGNGSRTFVIPIDTSLLTTGSSEFRFTYDVLTTVNGQAREQFNTTGWQGCVRTCDGPDRTLPWIEMRGWYGKDSQGINHNYQNVRLRSDPSCLQSGGVCKVEMKLGSGGRPTVLSWAAIDPDYHNGIGGTTLKQVNGPFSGSITIPTLSSGTHKLVLGASDGKNAGVGAFTFIVP